MDRSLYTSREYASKNPALSPIRERRSSGVPPPEAESESASCTGTHPPHHRAPLWLQRG